MIKAAIFGGSFNPIHYGHLITMQQAAEICAFDKVILIPAFISPLRRDVSMVSGEQRLKMIKLAIESDSLFEVSDFEIQKQGVSYTVETIREFKKLYNNLSLIIGYDNYQVFDKWKEPEEILDLCEVVVLKRKSNSEQVVTHEFADRFKFIDSPMIEISSTMIRERIKYGADVGYYTPDAVAEYIKRCGLYK